MNKLEQLRQFISPFINGPNADAILSSLAAQAQATSDLAVAVTDQLTISTASGEYLEQRLSEINIIQPPDLGMSDDALRRLGISVTADKQITELIHTILNIFYGPETVRAHTTSTQAEPYILESGMDLILSLEDDEPITIVLDAAVFTNINNATAQEVADAITRGLRAHGYRGFATVFNDFINNQKYVRIYGGANGPYSLVKVLGGQVQNILEFPTIRGTDLAVNDTTWEITRNRGNTIRFRWTGGSTPALDRIMIGDRVMIYGAQFIIPVGSGQTVDLRGTFEVTNVRLPKTITSYDAGWFEIQQAETGLRSSLPDVAPPSNAPPVYYSYTVNQVFFDDLKFFQVVKNTPYNQQRYALAFEPAGQLLKVYLPVTTDVVYRDLIGASHLHLGYESTHFDGSFGSLSDQAQQIEILDPYTLRYPQPLLDASASAGNVQIGAFTYEIESIRRENYYTTVRTVQPHGLIGLHQWDSTLLYDTGEQVWHAGGFWQATEDGVFTLPTLSNPQWQWLYAGQNYTDAVISVEAVDVPADDLLYAFLGPYMWDTTVNYELTPYILQLRETIYAGESRSAVIVDGTAPMRSGQLLLNLGYSNQESPVPYIDLQTQSDAMPVPISYISQNGNVVTVTTLSPHSAIPGSKVMIASPIYNGEVTVNFVINSFSYTATSPISQVATAASGTSTLVLENVLSTLILSPGYTFKHRHDIGSNITVLHKAQAYIPKEDGSDYPTYLTGTAEGTQFAQQLIKDIAAAGLNLQIILVYPGPAGLGNDLYPADGAVTPHSDLVGIYSVK